MWRIPAVAAMLVLMGATCAFEPCDRYVDYMCQCHADDPGFDCAELQQVYGDADPELQDQCAIDLTDQKDEDADAGLDCEVDSGVGF